MDCVLTASKDNNHSHTPKLFGMIQSCSCYPVLLSLASFPRNLLNSKARPDECQAEGSDYCCSWRWGDIALSLAPVSISFWNPECYIMMVPDVFILRCECTCLSLVRELIWQEAVCYSAENRSCIRMLLPRITLSRLFPIHPIYIVNP